MGEREFMSAWIGASIDDGVVFGDDIGRVLWVDQSGESLLDLGLGAPVERVAHLVAADRLANVSPLGVLSVHELSTGELIDVATPHPPPQPRNHTRSETIVVGPEQLDGFRFRDGEQPGVEIPPRGWLSVSDEGRRVFLPGPWGMVVDLTDGSVVSRPDTDRIAALDPTGAWIAALCFVDENPWWGGIEILDASSGRPLVDPVSELPLCVANAIDVDARLRYAVAWAADGRELVASGWDKDLNRLGDPCEFVWVVPTWDNLRSDPDDVRYCWPAVTFDREIRHIARSDPFTAWVSVDGVIGVADNNRQQLFQQLDAPLLALRFWEPDRLVAASADGGVVAWRLPDAMEPGRAPESRVVLRRPGPSEAVTPN